MKRAFPVRIAAKRRGRVRVRAGKVAHAKTVRFRHRGRKTVRLKLTARGRRTLRSCGRRARVTIRAGKKRIHPLLKRRRCASSPPRLLAAAREPRQRRHPGGARRLRHARGLRLLRPRGLPPAMAQRLLQCRRQGHRHRRRLHLTAGAMPKNVAGKAIEPGDYNRNDGFSPGSPIHTKIPSGLDNQAAFNRTGLVPETDTARSFDPGQPAVVIDADSGERQLIWAELDAQAGSDPGRSLDADPFYGIGTTGFPSPGSVYEPWDAGAGYNALAPAANTPPVESDTNQDPHGVPRKTAAAQDQKSDHLKAGGTITDRCAGGPCHSDPDAP